MANINRIEKFMYFLRMKLQNLQKKIFLKNCGEKKPLIPNTIIIGFTFIYDFIL